MSQLPNCLFCRIVTGEIPGQIVHKDDQLTAFRDINPAAPTHILIVPNQHIGGVSEIGPGDAATLAALLLRAKEIARQENLGAGYRLVINQGPDGGQTVFHLHVHLLGGRPMTWPPG